MESLEKRDAILRRARRIELKSRRLVARVLAGETRSLFRGTGIEFDAVREYAYGDDVRAIDWNVTARAGRPFVKRFVTTRERDVIVAVDRSGSMRFGSGGPSSMAKEDSAATLAVILAFVTSFLRERIGLVEFGNASPLELAPRRERGTADRFLRSLVTARRSEPRIAWADLAERLDRLLKRRSLLFLVSDFHEPPPLPVLGRLRFRHEVIAVRIVDPREERLEGSGVVVLEDPKTRRTFALDAGSATERAEYAARAKERAERHQELLRDAGIEGFSLQTSDENFAAFFAFIEARRRGLR